jgi:hypothetical protein
VSDNEVFNLDLDEELLNHLAIEESWITLQGEDFDPALIEDEEIAEIYSWQRSHRREHGQLATPSVLADEFDLDFQEPLTSVGDLLDRMRLRYMRNGGRRKLVEVVEAQRNGDPLDVPAMLLNAGRELSHLLAKRGEVFGTGDYERARHRYEQKVALGPGASFGYAEIDTNYNGMHGLNILLGYKKSGKSWQMLQSLALNAQDGRYPWLYSLELPADETDMRFRCLCADVPWWRYIKNQLGPSDWKAIHEVSDILDGSGLYKIVKPPKGARGINEMVGRARDAGAGIVLIDQLQYVENPKGMSLGRLNDTGEYFGVLDDARDLSDDGPLYIAHQFGRQAAFAEEMPDISMAKGSSSIEEVCTVALGIWSSAEMRRSGLMHIGELIARNGTGVNPKWELDVEMQRGCRFDITREVEDDNE